MGPHQISRHRGDNQLLSAAALDPGTLQGPQEGDTGPQYAIDDKVLAQEFAAINGQCPGEKQLLQTVPGARPII